MVIAVQIHNIAGPFLPRLDAHTGHQVEDTERTRMQDVPNATSYFEKSTIIKFGQ